MISFRESVFIIVFTGFGCVVVIYNNITLTTQKLLSKAYTADNIIVNTTRVAIVTN
jgi:hypothetical protein